MTRIKSPRTRTKGFKPNGPLGDAFEERAHSAFNIWYLTAPKAGGDIVLRSDAELLHMLSLEANPQVKSYLLQSPRKPGKVAEGTKDLDFDFEVFQKTGQILFSDVMNQKTTALAELRGRALDDHEARERLAAARGGAYELIGREQLVASRVQALNFLEGIAYRNAAKGLPLVKYRAELGALVRSHGRLTVSTLQKLFPRGEHAEMFAALFAMLADGELCSDLST